MGRGRAKVLLEIVSKKTYQVEQVVEAGSIWVVLYKNQPFNLKVMKTLGIDGRAVYKKVVFTSAGHAKGLASKLNEKYRCSDFSAVKLEVNDGR